MKAHVAVLMSHSLAISRTTNAKLSNGVPLKPNSITLAGSKLVADSVKEQKFELFYFKAGNESLR